MIFNITSIQDVFIIDLEKNSDERGYNTRVFSQDLYQSNAFKFPIVQINKVKSVQKGTIRGIHMQKSPMSEDKLIQCTSGSIFDVVIDLRKNSETYGKLVTEILSNENNKMILVPKGCAHGFQALEDNSIIQYAVSQFYSPKHEIGLLWNDPYFKIRWPIKKAIVSTKDSNWPHFPHL